MKLETKRLILREFRPEDFDALYEILSDAQTMQHYPAPFDAQKVENWILRNRKRYSEDGFGLWAVELKENGRQIGDCGITMQMIHGQLLPEVGYHIHRDYQKCGYATEAAAACLERAFGELGMPRVYSYMKYTNEASARVAMKNGMQFVEEYEDPVNVLTKVYAISREEWLMQKES